MKNEKPLWGPETAKALRNFGGDAADIEHSFEHSFSPETLAPIPRQVLRAYSEVKLAAIEALQETESYFTQPVMNALRVAAAAMIRGELDHHFPLPMAQGGAGTSFHMNVNEVMAARASLELKGNAEASPIDPIEDLARYQSTNDTFASAAVITAFRIAEALEEKVVQLQEALVKLETRYDGVLITGRTEMQDALPMRLGSLFGAWAGAAERDRWRLSKVAERVREVPLGGTALGNGFGAPRRYAHAAERQLRRITGLPVSRSQNMMDGVALKDSLAEVAGGVRIAALNAVRVSGDLLYYSSAPVGEINHPKLQYGSSMMLLKTNPVLLDRCRGIALSAMGEMDKVDTYAREGQLQLNAYLPFLLRSLTRGAEECRLALDDLCRFLDTMEVNKERMERNLVQSPAILNALMPLVGYRKLKSLEDRILKEKIGNLADLAQVCAQETQLPLERIQEELSPSRLTGPPKEQL